MTTAEQPVTADQRADLDRAVFIARLRAMATWLEDNPAVPVSPWMAVNISMFTDSTAEARDAMAAAPGGWRKKVSATSDYTTYEHGDDDIRNEVIYELHVRKDATCERVQVGVKHVEEHDEPVYRWKCAPDA
jgi:hypothetical protein